MATTMKTPSGGGGSMDEMYASESGGGKNDAPETTDQERDEDAGNTALIDNKVLSPDGEPLKEGDEIVLKIVKNYGDECEVAYAPKEGGKPKGEHGGMMDDSDAELDGMDKPD